MPAEITLVVGESWSFSLLHIYSEIEIGTEFAIGVREKIASNLITITNRESSTDLYIDTTGIISFQSVEV